MMTGMTDHLSGKSGNMTDLLKALSDAELREQSTHYLVEGKKLEVKGSTFGAFKYGNLRAAVKREQEYRAQRTPVE